MTEENKFTKRTNKVYKDLGNYIVYQDGRVFSKRRGIFVTPYPDKRGYLVLRAPKMCKLHRLIATCFIPNPLGLPEINHKDGNKTNNTLSNLEWCTSKHNINHAYQLGLMKPKFGIENPSSKIRYIDLTIIKEALSKGHSGADIARYYKVDKSTIYRIKNNITWRQVA